MKKYKHTKTWIGEDGKRKVVRANDQGEMWRKYYQRRYGVDGLTEAVPDTVLTKLIKASAGSKEFVSSYAWKVAELKRDRVSDDYWYQYTKLMNKHVVQNIGWKTLDSVTRQDCQDIMDSLAGRSASLIKKVYQILRQIFRRATTHELIEQDPTEGLEKPPARVKQERRALTDEERAALHTVWEKYPDEMRIFKIMYYTGARPSECWSMRKRDVHTVNGRRMLDINGTKTENAVRSVPFPDEIWQDVQHLKRDEYLTTTGTGSVLNRDSYRRRARRLSREMNIALGAEMYRNEIVEDRLNGFVPYDIRHDYCTRLATAGVDVRVAQKLMGHSKIDITVDIYSHIGVNAITKDFDRIISGVTGVLP